MWRECACKERRTAVEDGFRRWRHRARRSLRWRADDRPQTSQRAMCALGTPRHTARFWAGGPGGCSWPTGANVSYMDGRTYVTPETSGVCRGGPSRESHLSSTHRRSIDSPIIFFAHRRCAARRRSIPIMEVTQVVMLDWEITAYFGLRELPQCQWRDVLCACCIFKIFSLKVMLG